VSNDVVVLWWSCNAAAFRWQPFSRYQLTTRAYTHKRPSVRVVSSASITSNIYIFTRASKTHVVLTCVFTIPISETTTHLCSQRCMVVSDVEIIIIIIKYIYIALVCRRKRRKCTTRVHSCMSNRKVFSLILNVSIAMSGSRSSAGRLFQTRGPWSAKLRSPNFVLVRGTQSWPVCAERRWRLLISMLHFWMRNILKFTQKCVIVLIPYLLTYSQQMLCDKITSYCVYA